VPVVELNTEYHDKAPFLSFDGLTLYFSRDISPGTHYSRIYEARRSAVSEPFEAATEISSLNHADGHVSGPWVSPDNLRMYYYITGGRGKRLQVAERDSTEDQWIHRLDIAELNELGNLTSPTLTRDERIIVFSGLNLPGGHGQWDLWMAQRADRDAPFQNVTHLGAVNTEAFDVHPSITPEGLTLYFTSNRSGVSQIFRARRESLDAPFEMVEHLSAFDTPGGASEFPFLGRDGRTMYFGRWPAGEDMDIYMACIPCTYYADVLLGADDQDGLSLLTAFATIQKAIDVAVDGDTISVLPGVYRESIRFAGKAVTVRSAWDAAILEAPDEWAVSFQKGEGPDSVLRNLIIRNSLVGIWLLNSSPTITNVTVVGNEFGIDASGDARPRISNCILWDNAVSDLYGCRVTYSCIERGARGKATSASTRCLSMRRTAITTCGARADGTGPSTMSGCSMMSPAPALMPAIRRRTSPPSASRMGDV